jgi:hypothetical protein
MTKSHYKVTEVWFPDEMDSIIVGDRVAMSLVLEDRYGQLTSGAIFNPSRMAQTHAEYPIKEPPSG